MLRPAAVTAAAVWLLALLGTGLTPAKATTETDFTLCSHSFYRQSPPWSSSDRPLRPLCHAGPGGHTFATLYQPACGSAVYSAFLVNNEVAASSAEDGPVSQEEESVTVVVPSLLRGDSEEPEPSPAASHLQQWDSAVTARVQSSIAPPCHSLGGELYVLIGAGRLGALGDEVCQTKLLWSAACCSAPEGKDSFSVAFIKETEGEEKQVTVEELVAILGVTELFSGGCGVDGASVAASLSSTSQASGVPASEVVSEAEEIENVNSGNSDETPDKVESSEQAESSSETQVTSEENPAVAKSAKKYRVSPDESEEDALSSEGRSPSKTQALTDPSVSSEAGTEPSVSSETVEEEQADDNSTSTLFYILTTTLSILKAPLRPVVSTVTELPGQVSYVLQEDLGVLSALPGDTYSVFHLLVSDVFSWIRSVVNLVLGVGEACFSRIYYCTSSMGEALLNSCCTGVAGMGTLAGDGVGIFGGVLNNTWWVTKFFGGRLVEQSGDYVGTVVGELGGQASAVGCGVGNLLYKSGNCVWKVFRFAWRIVTGVINIILAIMDDAFERETVRNEVTIVSSES